MRQLNDHPLKKFVYNTFGPRLADLIMVGYNEKPSRRKKIFRITEEVGGRSVEWTIEALGKSLPSRQEPLVIAALLKILLRRPEISLHLEFRMEELVEEIGWNNSPLTQKRIDRIISNSAGLAFHKEPRNKRADMTGLKWGQYSLITAYIRESVRGAGGSLPRISRCVEINSSFVEGLKKGLVYFADINLGRIHRELK